MGMRAHGEGRRERDESAVMSMIRGRDETNGLERLRKGY